MSEELGSLGSLTQSARKKQLRTARIIMFVVGALSLAVNGFMFATTDTRLDAEVKKLQQQGMGVDQNALASIRTENLVASGIGFAIGAIFIVLGFTVYAKPVPSVLLALTLYIGSVVGFGIYNPLSVVQGILIKIIIIASLFKSLQAAKAYESEVA